VAHASHPAIHDVTPDDIEVTVIPDQQLCVGISGAGGALISGDIYIAGHSDRERLENLLAIAGRLRQASLDLIASMAANSDAQMHSTLGKPLDLPGAAPLHGTTVRVVAS
jgi:hypothetical protein